MQGSKSHIRGNCTSEYIPGFATVQESKSPTGGTGGENPQSPWRWISPGMRRCRGRSLLPAKLAARSPKLHAAYSRKCDGSGVEVSCRWYLTARSPKLHVAYPRRCDAVGVLTAGNAQLHVVTYPGNATVAGSKSPAGGTRGEEGWTIRSRCSLEDAVNGIQVPPRGTHARNSRFTLSPSRQRLH